MRGYPGGSWESIQYLAQCGYVGNAALPSKAIGDNKCGTAINTFVNGPELAGFYALDGTKQPGITNGTESCVCAALQQGGASHHSDRCAICLFSNSAGDLERIRLAGINGIETMEEGFVGNYVPGLKRSLLVCPDVDLQKLRADNANSTLPPDPLRVTNKIAACVTCKRDVTSISKISD